MKICIAFLLLSLSVALVYGAYQVRTECPQVDRDQSKTEADCPKCFDCGFSPGYKCCPNECGGGSCTNVMAGCTLDDIEYLHGDYLGYIEDKDNNKCIDFYCQNGNAINNTRDCDGPIN